MAIRTTFPVYEADFLKPSTLLSTSGSVPG